MLAVLHDWAYPLLLLALVLAVAGHAWRSRLVLGGALLAGALWLASGSLSSAFFPLARSAVQGTGWRLLGCAALYVCLRAVLGRRGRSPAPLLKVYEGFALHLAGVGALVATLPGYLDRPLPSGLFWAGEATLSLVVLVAGRLGWLRQQTGWLHASVAYAAAAILRLEFRLMDTLPALATCSLLTLLLAGLLMRQVSRRFPHPG